MNYRKILYPFSILYDGVTRMRNCAYDKGWKKSTKFKIPVISVGNLSVGGTGKSPMVEHLVSFLKDDYRVAVLSRGYKRKTNGYIEVSVSSTSEEVGDEPLQIKRKFPEITVAVCANRIEGIHQLEAKSELVVLDDAFQHRKVKPAFSILLTPFDDLFMDDLVLPAGNLRESKKGFERADVIVVTKCPQRVAYAKLQEIQFRMKLKEHQSIYFTSIGYGKEIQGRNESLTLEYLKDKEFTLVTGIANPEPLVAFLKQHSFQFDHLRYPDHHHFSEGEIEKLHKEDLILTTEKDFQRLSHRLDKKALYFLPIKTEFLYDRTFTFQQELKRFLEYYRKY